MFELTGGGIVHRYAGQPVPWLQQRIGDAVRAVATAAQRLQVAANDLDQAASDAGDQPRLAHVGRGYLALVAVARAVVASFRPDQELLQVPWERIDAIVDGIRRLEHLDGVELRDDVGHLLTTHDQRLTDLRATGLGKLADRLDSDPALQRALATMRAFVGVG